ncbi:hypothetical protein D3846_07435 [Streptococcus mutans]|uniref:Uncharacterized protein n=1 Tax=Streptococcus mutans serotype c (strain ATCC 700610 / UA159) TaxID=210007 RepID=Q8DTM3_STRMU|nr:hypothetical protein SMU_1310 [Streptococcus mutans UA159]ARS62637.1 hypothetical protein RO10_05205 [Streptococcus mutans]RKW08508.1 MAG: hypothetical protein D8H99_00730 [Streptococcus sp.]BAL69079.1 hypothetical protein SMULJ23_0745 [Streptococcus mutans LJ23]AVM71277.1 hypothetical protein CO204_04135 [Streptococcus mutans]
MIFKLFEEHLLYLLDAFYYSKIFRRLKQGLYRRKEQPYTQDLFRM